MNILHANIYIYIIYIYIKCVLFYYFIIFIFICHYTIESSLYSKPFGIILYVLVYHIIWPYIKPLLMTLQTPFTLMHFTHTKSKENEI
jgi:hypothetical protein